MNFELARRNALPSGTCSLCVLCASHEESTPHLFLNCFLVWKIWMKVYGWLEMTTVLPNSVSAHFLQFEVPGVRGKGGRLHP